MLLFINVYDFKFRNIYVNIYLENLKYAIYYSNLYFLSRNNEICYFYAQ